MKKEKTAREIKNDILKILVNRAKELRENMFCTNEPLLFLTFNIMSKEVTLLADRILDVPTHKIDLKGGD